MTKNCKVDFMTKEIRITKSFYKSAQIVGTPEFDTMINLQEKLPDYKITVKSPARPVNHVWYPTYSDMFTCLSILTEKVKLFSLPTNSKKISA